MVNNMLDYLFKLFMLWLIMAALACIRAATNRDDRL